MNFNHETHTHIDKMITKKTVISILAIGLSTVKSFGTIYTNDMDYVLGDVKQIIIQNRLTSNSQCDRLLDGFEEMEVNGIRIPFFANTSLIPNKSVFDYFYSRARARGFLLYANPAQSSGGRRVANGSLALGPATLNNSTATQNLINRTRAFANAYPCKWINPFNEDGRPGADWSAAQMNTVYSSLYRRVNGAELIGPCVWGVPASTLVLQQTRVHEYISVAATHNLGFNHSSWPGFISAARDRNLPVWDSEVNHSDRFGTGTRLEAALANNVDGLVLYNSWQGINRNTGVVNQANRNLMDLYLKPRVQIRKRNSLGFCLDGGSGGRNGQNVQLYSYIKSHPNLTWEEIDRGNGYFSYQKKGTNFSLDGGNGGNIRQNVFLWTTNPNNRNQHWRKVSTGGGNFKLQKRNSTGFAINGGSGGRRGQNVNLWTFGSGSHNLQWVVEEEQ